MSSIHLLNFFFFSLAHLLEALIGLVGVGLFCAGVCLMGRLLARRHNTSLTDGLLMAIGHVLAYWRGRDCGCLRLPPHQANDVEAAAASAAEDEVEMNIYSKYQYIQ